MTSGGCKHWGWGGSAALKARLMTVGLWNGSGAMEILRNMERMGK